MTLDLTQFHETFFAESAEALDQMEAALLKLSAGEADLELVNTIFRVAHSIKGGSATFGFSEVAGFTHILETLLDQLRAGKRRVDSSLVDTLLRSCDLMRAMLGATQAKQPIDEAARAALHAEIELIMATPAHAHAAAVQAPAPVPAPEEMDSGWRIHFVPGPKLLRNGNDPLRLLRELATLAPCDIRVDAKWVPPLTELDPEECRLSWKIELKGPVQEAAIRAVFDWVEGECDLNLEAFGPAHGPRAEAAAAVPVAAPASSPAIPAPPPAPAPALDESVAQKNAAAAAPAAASAAAGDGGSIRVSIEKIDELL